MQRISPVHQQQKHKQLHRRQRGVLLPVNDPEDTVSSVAVSSLSTSPAGGRGSKAKVEEDDDEDGGSQALSTW